MGILFGITVFCVISVLGIFCILTYQRGKKGGGQKREEQGTTLEDHTADGRLEINSAGTTTGDGEGGRHEEDQSKCSTLCLHQNTCVFKSKPNTGNSTRFV